MPNNNLSNSRGGYSVSTYGVLFVILVLGGIIYSIVNHDKQVLEDTFWAAVIIACVFGVPTWIIRHHIQGLDDDDEDDI